MKKLMVVLCTVVMLSALAVAPVSAAINGLAVSSPATSSSNPWLYDVETGKTYFEVNGNWYWTCLYGLEYSASPNGDELATIYGNIVECDNLADGYEQFPLEYVTMEPIEVWANPGTWYSFNVIFSLPLKPKYCSKHYQIDTEFSVQIGSNIWFCVGDETFLITSEYPKRNIKPLVRESKHDKRRTR